MKNKINFPIQMYDPKREYKNIKSAIDGGIQKVLDHGLFINGPEVSELEQKLSQYIGSKHCIAVSNGTDALKIALLALDIGINDEVITVSHTWISTAEIISLINAIPVFVDINVNDFCIDINKIESKITTKTKAIIVVSLYGQMPDLHEINKIAEKYSIHVIEDGAQSFGAKNGDNYSSNMTTIGTTSFFPSKPLGCYGDGGACFTNDAKLAVKIRAIKNHGGTKRFCHEYIGLNGRLDTIQAAILLQKFPHFDECLKRRNDCANYYSKNLKKLEERGLITLPKVKDGYTSAWAQYSILARNNVERDSIVSYLKENQVNVAIFYPAPLHTQKCFEYLNYKKDDFPVTEKVCDTIFNLPCYGEITLEEQDYIIQTIFGFFKQLS